MKKIMKEQKMMYKQPLKNKRDTLKNKRKKFNDLKDDRSYQDKPVKLQINFLFQKYGITPQQYHGGSLAWNHIQLFTHYANKICEEIANIFKSCSMEPRRQPVSDEDIDSKFEKLADILIIADGIYSKCHVPSVSLTDEDLHTISNTIEILSRIWREA